MKKTIITALILSLFFSSTATASANYETSVAVTYRTSAAPADYAPEPQEDSTVEYRTPEGFQGTGLNKNPEYYYHEFGYPEYLSYIAAYDKFLAEGDELVVQFRAGLTDMSQENIDEVLSVMDSSCWVVFEQASYSYNERTAVYEQLREEFPECYVSLGYDNERIIIYTPADSTEEEYLKKLNGRFAGLVFVCGSDGVLYDAAVGTATGERVSVPDGGLGSDTGGPVVMIGVDNTGTILLITIIAVLLFIVGGAFLLMARSRIRIGSDGTAAAVAVLTKKDVKQLISDSAEAPSPHLRERILK